jgi:glutaminase
VARHVGFEPSGDAFNAISLDEHTGRPANPMINAGAIVTSALVGGTDSEDRFERIRTSLSAFAGRDLGVDERVFASERDTGDRNRALGYLTRATGVLPRPVPDAVDVYFRQCAVLVTAADLAVMGATLANAGVNPETGHAVITEEVAEYTLAVMASCGMYDYAGTWMLRVGLPAKSGVGGGIVAVKPGQFGIGVYSPPLDQRGNSTRGVAALKALSRDYGLHLLSHPAQPRSPIEAVHLDGEELVVELRGELDFVAAEQVARRLTAAEHERAAAIVIDTSGVTLVRPVAEQLLAATVLHLREAGTEVVVRDDR